MDWAVACLNYIKTLCQMERTSQPHPVNWDRIYDHMKNNKNNNNVFKRFMPSSSIDELTTKEKVLSTLRSSNLRTEQIEELANFVVEKGARRIFLCLTFIDGLQYLSDFMDAKFTDKDLPSADRTNAEIAEEDNPTPGEQQLETYSDTEYPVKDFPLKGKSRKVFTEFLDQQWFFLSPNCSKGLSESLEIIDFHDRLPMAYIPPSSNDGSIPTSISTSNFSVVWRVHLHPNHFGHQQSTSSAKSSSKGIEAALKILKVSGGSDDANIEDFYTKEAKTLQKMASLNHGHLISTILIYKSGQDRCFLFPWAHGGNLNEFWKSFDELKQNIDFVAWSLDQMHGIFEGLNKLHQQKIRHGDIKPHNILHFPQNERGSASGLLTIADVGLSKFHQEYTTDRRYTSTTQCTVMYQPPEIKGRRRSRLFDYWSLGCVFLEFTIWIYDGYGGLCKFRKSLKDSQPNPPEDKIPRFWDYERGQTPKLNTAVKNTMDEIQKKDTSLSKFGNELIELIKTKLLNIDAYRGKKIGTWNKENAEVVRKEVFAIRERYMESDKCLWSSLLEKDRAGSDQLADLTAQPTAMNLSTGGANRTSELVDQWRFVRDVDSATSILSQLDWPSLRPQTQSLAFCRQCKNIDFDQSEWDLFRNMRDLERSSPDCALCRFFVQSIAGVNLKSGEPVTLIRDNKAHVVRLLGQDLPVISLYSEPDFANKNLSAPPPGLPLLTEMGSPQQKKLLNAWINLCNKTHSCSLDKANGSAPGRHMPTRLISVGYEYTSTIRLVDSIELSNDKYVALSHRWGDVPNQKMVRTTVSNIDDFKKEIRFESLPRTFQDAVKLARVIGVAFLWIDSLCIIQGDEEDWAKEAARMEEVFSYAYCVFAATSAKSSLGGFLGDRKPRPSVAVSTSGNRMYLSKYIDDFENDVEHGLLNTRGWVLQERALARRTIHITSTQIYWECGHGIYCETLAQLENPQSRLLGDAHFPESSFRYYKYKDEWIRLLQYIQELYSGLTLGYLTDRPKAMLGIEKRIARVFKSQARYGIYEVFFARTMLWTASVSRGLTRIDPMGGKRVPSWSWMSYAGKITYVDIPFRKVLWLDNLKSPFDTNKSLESWDEHLFGTANDLVVDAWESMTEIVFDCGFDQHDRNTWKCVLLGREGAAIRLEESVYYALIIRPVIAADSSRYERVGAGRLNHWQISHKTQEVVII
ncbi:unnamed protein product [Clonostachys rhizophaga]|uniref:Protein kinase domain-containing protein n=1 Tax=Clonostachys rhizophaga TaxID=160324 RepID=A0A9N9YJU9_9HYPO|nr:unnamed protein product [Clonostachys rhizophaga]